MRIAIWAVATIMLVGAEAPTTQPARTGSFRTSYRERSPLSPIAGIAERLGVGPEAMKRATGETDYGLAMESFEVRVPRTYSGQEPYGVLVWISPGDTVGMPGEWEEVLDRHKLIWIGANKSGNERAPVIRMALGLDAVHNIKKSYRVDEDRVYVAGLSGGGRVASMLAIVYPDVFQGGFYMCGCNYYRDTAVPGEEGQKWRRSFAAPSAKLLTEAKKRRHVLLTGESDINRPQTLAYSEAYKRDSFQYVTYLEVPGLGHGPPDAEWLGKGIVALDRPLQGVGARQGVTTKSASGGEKVATEAARSNGKAAADLEAAKELAAEDPVAGYEAFGQIARKYANTKEGALALVEADKLLGDSKVRKVVEDRQEADKLVRVARIYVSNRMFEEARERLRKVMKEYPDTPACKQAANMLEEIRKE